ncbi:MAG TPA: hypothetical protein VNX86_04575 [Rhizomicrobium sp.]|jgi:hypothetical protein|nr:hypothetical protein [Rhizomicrobium sp.]
MTTHTQTIHAVRYRLSQAVTKLAPLYTDPKELKRVLQRMIDYEISAIENERACPTVEDER